MDSRLFQTFHPFGEKVGFRFAYNMKLSADRAHSVVTALVKEHSIAGSRLEAHGVGALAPVASNKDEAGRARNRRVELVAK
ncbi:MAG: OmpA family protein [bacterium]